MSIFELTLEDTLVRKNSNKIWFFTCLFVSLQAKTMQKKIIKPIYILTMKKLAYIFVVLLVGMTACEKKQHGVSDVAKMDSVVVAPLLAGDPDGTIALADSFERLGTITHIHASNRRGEAYLQKSMMIEADREFNSAVTGTTPKNQFDSVLYYSATGNIVQYMSARRSNDSVIALAVPTLQALKDFEYAPEYATEILVCKSMLYMYLGLAQRSLRRYAEYDKSFEQSHLYMRQLLEIDPSWGSYFNAAMCYHNFLLCYIMDEKTDKVVLWLSRADSVAEKLYAHPSAIDSYKEQIKYNLTCDRIDLAVLQKRFDDADRYYNEVKKSPLAQTVSGQFKQIDYLRDLHRYAEAADAYQSLGGMIAQYKMNPSLDFVGKVAGKFRMNYMAGRKDSALAAALFAFDYIDSAIVRERNNEAAKLATIYQTQQKDEEIAQQQIEMSRQRIVALVTVLVLITAFFIVYTLFRRRAAKRMAEMKAQQERIESELRIARDIQMSMVPSTFPEYEGLDLYATMTPAKEVGGDLYGYVINGHNLYFALGDVSGKGVPASLFMAQATRLFRTMANQGLMPAEICNHMNAELSGEDNVNGMFVTMFIGMLNMENGHLLYCNAGHNPPVIGGGENKGDFLQMEANAPIGLFPEIDYQGEEIDSIKGRALFIYTDGLNEAEDKEQHQFGDKKLLEILRDTHFDTARQVVETLTEKVEEHRAGAEPNDDLTMLCLRVS